MGIACLFHRSRINCMKFGGVNESSTLAQFKRFLWRRVSYYSGKNMLLYLGLIRIFAIFLIVNSHLWMLKGYPSFLPFGGHLGNSLFYFISGFGLALSYKNKPLPYFPWIIMRGLKLIVPIFIFCSFVEFGNWHNFISLCSKYFLFNDWKGLESFIPVLIVLYMLFIPLYKLRPSVLLFLMFLVSCLALFLLLQRISVLVEIPKGLPSNDVFFSMNALICFCGGIYSSKESLLDRLYSAKIMVAWISIILLLSTQASHQVMFHLYPKLIYLNFFLNFLSVISIFLYFGLCFTQQSQFFYRIASCSLAVYIIHFSVIGVVNTKNLSFPFNFLDFLILLLCLAYPLTRLTDFISKQLVDFVKKHFIKRVFYR